MKSDVFHLGDVSFDITTRTLTDKEGRPAQLRNKSKEVLERLLATPNQTVPKAEILNNVWSDVIASDESLVQCIADIRRVIGDNVHHIIETVPREGYRLNLQSRSVRPKQRTAVVAASLIVTTCAAAVWFYWPETADRPAPPSRAMEVLDETGPPGTDSTEAYLEVLKGRISSNQFNLGESLTAERHFRQAIGLDPNFARAYAELGTLLAVRFENDWNVLTDADRQKALFYAEKAVSLDPDLWLGHYALGRLHSIFSEYDLAERHLERAMSLQPDNEDARAYYGVVKFFRGDFEEAAAIIEAAVRSHPNPPFWYYLTLGNTSFNLGQFERAKNALETCVVLAEKSPYCLRYLIGVYGQLGDVDAAEAASRDYASMGFDLSIDAILLMMPFHHPDDLAQLERSLRLANVPD